MIDEFVMMFSDNVVWKVKSLIEEEGNDSLKFCVYIIGGGCVGFFYGFKFEEDLKDDDI